MGDDETPGPFVVKDCAVTALATGADAWTLRELRDRLARIPDGSLYYHFQGRRLRPVFEAREFNNDLADWSAFSLRDRVLAERLALLDPADYEGIPDLREELIDLVEERIAELGRPGAVTAAEPFYFIEAQIVVFDTHRRIGTPAELGEHCGRLSRGSVYYHMVDARYRNPDGRDDFQLWLAGFGSGCEALAARISQIDVYFSTLVELRDRLTELCGGSPAGGHR